MANFGNLLNTFSAAGGAMPAAENAWLQVQARQRALADAQRQDAARKAFFQSLTTPDMAALPQQGGGFMQPQQPAGAAPTLPMPTSAAATDVGGGSVSNPAPAAPPAMQPGPTPTAGAAPTGQGGGPFGVPDPTQRLRAMAMSIKRANPGVDDLTLATALQQQVDTMRGLSPDDRAALQAQTQIMRIQAQSDAAVMRANSAAEVAQIRADTAQQIAQLRDSTQRYGINTRADTAREGRMASMERLKYQQNAIDQRAAQAAGTRADAKQKAAQYKQIMAQRAQVKDQIAGAGGIATPEQQKQLDALDQKAIQFWSGNNWLPRPSELDRMSGTEAPAGGNTAPPGPGAAPAPAPSSPGAGGGGPAAGTVEGGYRFKGGNPADQANWEKVQ